MLDRGSVVAHVIQGMLDGGVDPGGKRRRPGRPATAECVDYTIQLMKDDRIVQRLNPSKNRRKAWIEYIVVLFDGIRQVDGPHAGLSCNAVQFLQGQFGVADRQFDAYDKAVGIFLVNLNASVIDNLRQMRALLRRSPLPWHR